jgi:thiosulfate dehydrogenase [quinone] large subunit
LLCCRSNEEECAVSSRTKRPVYLEPTQKLPVSAALSPAPAGRRFPGLALLPLRLFLGVTFVYAGVQKIADPQFFHPGSPGYIGNQLLGFAHGSPLRDLLLHVALPHALLVGWAIALGEIAIGLGTLVGLLLRAAAFCGLLLNLIFWLTASWHVYPYFYGSDIVFIFSWLTLLLVGPLFTGLPTLDGYLLALFFPEEERRERGLSARLVALLLGDRWSLASAGRQDGPAPAYGPGQQRAPQRPGQQQRLSSLQRRRESRRSFVLGALAGAAGALTLAVLGALPLLRRQGLEGVSPGTLTPLPGATTSATTTASSTPSAGGTVIAREAAVAPNSAITFTLPSNGDPAVLVHLADGQFVAYDAVCTHAGCEVSYDSESRLLICPCHGAEFDPAHGATVVNGPAPAPLTPVAIRIDSAGNIVLQ